MPSALAVLLAFVGPIAYLAPLGLAPLVGLMGLCCIRIGLVRFPWPAFALLAAFMLWASASMLWSPARPWMGTRSLASAIEHLTIVEVAAAAVLSLLVVNAVAGLRPKQARQCVLALGWSVLGLTLALIVDSLAGGEIYRWLASFVQPAVTPDLAKIYAARGGYVLAVLMWSLLPALSRRARLAALLPACAVVLVSVFLHQQAPVAALLAGAAAFALVAAAGRTGLTAIAVFQGALWLGMPWAFLCLGGVVDFHRLQDLIKPSWSERLKIWTFAADRISERPWSGWGMDASRAFPRDIPLHTHNWPLQVWLELGLPGALMALALWLGLLWKVAGLQSRFQMASAAAAATAYLVIGGVSFGLWQQWWLAAGVLALVGANLVVGSRLG